MKILIVEDDPALQSWFLRAFNGNDVSVTDNPDDAVNYLSMHTPDIIFLDYNLKVGEKDITSEPVARFLAACPDIKARVILHSGSPDKSSKLRDIIGRGEIVPKMELVMNIKDIINAQPI